MVEDDIDRLVRKLEQKKADYTEHLLAGGAAPDNVADGYYATCARIAAYAEAIELIREELANWAEIIGPGNPPARQQRPRPLDY